VVDSAKAMRVGIDIDNTIINYESAFLLLSELIGLKVSNDSNAKELIKNSLKSRFKGESLWNFAQGLVYGPLARNAKLYPNCFDVITFLKKSKSKIFLVSHKTINPINKNLSHFDLRDITIKFLQQERIINHMGPIYKENIFFCDSIDEKVEKINSLNLDIFIDDLEEVLNHVNWPKKTFRLLFANNVKNKIINGDRHSFASNWNEIKAFFNGRI